MKISHACTVLLSLVVDSVQSSRKTPVPQLVRQAAFYLCFCNDIDDDGGDMVMMVINTL